MNEFEIVKPKRLKELATALRRADYKSGSTGYILTIVAYLSNKYFLEKKGKDASRNRWRISFYYDGGHASTLFFENERQYNKFIEHFDNGYETYDEFRRYCNADLAIVRL